MKTSIAASGRHLVSLANAARLFPLLLLVGVLYCHLTTQTLVCSGIVTDEETGLPLAKAVVEITDLRTDCSDILHTHDNGWFEYFAKEAVPHMELRITKEGYRPLDLHLCGGDFPLEPQIIKLRKAIFASH